MRWITAFVCCLLFGALAPAVQASVGGGGPTNTATISTFDHRYELHYGTLTVFRTGEPTPVLSRNAFELEIRVDSEARDQIASGLANDPRVVAGLASPAPDGGSYVTTDADPTWWTHPNGIGNPESQPTFPAATRFTSAMAPPAAGEGEQMTCSDTTADTVLKEPADGPGLYPSALITTTTFGPATVHIGEQRSQTYEVLPGSLNINTEFSYLVVEAHRLDRNCTITGADNCPAEANADQKDTDGDDIGDACDEDPSLPDSCGLRKARARVFVYKEKPKVRLVVRYRTRRAGQVTTTYSAKTSSGWVQIGKVKRRFSAEGIFKLPKSLRGAKLAKVRAAKRFRVRFTIPGTPTECARFYTKELTKKVRVKGQSVFFQSDSVLAGF